MPDQCQCTNDHLIKLNGFCEICMSPVNGEPQSEQTEENWFGPGYFAALEMYLESQTKENHGKQ